MSLFEAEFESPGELQEWETGAELGSELGGSSGEFESYESYEAESGEVNEAAELELAYELLEVTSEAELEQFLGNLVRSVGRAASGFIRSPVGRALGGVLRNVAKRALPMVGSAVGTFIAPGVGTALGGKLGSMAGNLLEAEELEVMSESEAELEMARRYVSWARGTTQNAMRAPYRANPNAAVRAAAIASARRHAPGLLRPGRSGNWRRRGPGRRSGTYSDQWAGAGTYDNGWDADDGRSPDSSGQWVRRGTRIVLLDV
jgi:hypothetical protein